MRDYIGSADAYAIYKGGYDALIRSKLKDSDFISPKMQRGLTLERDIIEQYRESGVHGLSDDAKSTFQVSVVHPEMDYCKATLDGVISDGDDEVIAEAKTSEDDPPDDEDDLMVKYPQYYYQVQWQMWLAGAEQEPVLWCKCPPIDSGESPYDGNGWLDVTEIVVTANPEVHAVFAENAPVFWGKWEEAKASAAEGKDLGDLVDLPAYLVAVEEEASIQKAIEEKVGDLITKAAQAKEKAAAIRDSILEAMKANGIIKYENERIAVTYIAPSTKSILDTDRLKKEGIYERYLKKSDVKESIRIKVKETADA